MLYAHVDCFLLLHLIGPVEYHPVKQTQHVENAWHQVDGIVSHASLVERGEYLDAVHVVNVFRYFNWFIFTLFTFDIISERIISK